MTTIDTLPPPQTRFVIIDRLKVSRMIPTHGTRAIRIEPEEWTDTNFSVNIDSALECGAVITFETREQAEARGKWGIGVAPGWEVTGDFEVVEVRQRRVLAYRGWERTEPTTPPTHERVSVAKDRMTPGWHVFLDGRSVTGGDAEWCHKVSELLKAGIDWMEEHDTGPKGGPG